MIIPTISVTAIQDSDIERLMEIGFAYVQLPNPSILAKIQECIAIARTFFQGSAVYKKSLKVKEVILPGEKYQGYALRTGNGNTINIEQFFFEPDSPYGPYEKHVNLINEIRSVFSQQIFLVVLQSIFTKLGIQSTHFKEVIQNPSCSLVFNSYTAMDADKNLVRFNAHKDFGLLTVLYFSEPGLEVFYQDQWHPISPKPNCVVVNLGNALELITAKRCHSALHRVTNLTDDRTSLVYFYNPNNHSQVKNYIEDTVIAESGAQFFKEQFEEYYQTTS